MVSFFRGNLISITFQLLTDHVSHLSGNAGKKNNIGPWNAKNSEPHAQKDPPAIPTDSFPLQLAVLTGDIQRHLPETLHVEATGLGGRDFSYPPLGISPLEQTKKDRRSISRMVGSCQTPFMHPDAASAAKRDATPPRSLSWLSFRGTGCGGALKIPC